MSPLDHALALADQGIASFPCGENKRPTTPNGLYAAATDPAELRRLWRAHPGIYLGVPTGEPSRICVLDIDAKHQSAHAWWRSHQHQLRGSTRAHRTKSGGVHICFHYHLAFPCTVGRIATGIDTRGPGGYAIWWPAAGYPVLCGKPITPVPEWLLQQLKPREPLPPPRRVIPDDQRLRALVRCVASAPEGQRNALLYWAARRFQEMLGADLTEGHAINLLLQAAQPTGLPFREALATIRSGLNGPRA